MSITARQLLFTGGSSNNPENPESCFMSRFLPDLRPIAELPEHYRSIFQDYASFNIIQSKTLDDVLYTDASIVVSAPTGSGKTGVFELAIVRMLMTLENTPFLDLFKIVYLSPMKALCEERLIDWNKKFQNFNVNCISVTGDSDIVEFQHLLNHNLIITTPEKWDSLTRRWKDNKKLVQVVKLFMIDEVHLLNEETRGSTLEAVVCRMKTIQDSLSCSECDEDIAKYKVRFVSASATVANIEDVADWIGKPPNVKYFKFSDDMRPVKLKKVVLGYNSDPKSTWFKFDLMLNYKLQSLLIQYANGKPTLIFCSTRKIVEMTAMHIVQHLTISLQPEQKDRLTAVAQTISDAKVREMLASGVGYHHAGMLSHNRHAIENLFRSGDLPVLVTTRTLAMGVNLPAHLVIIKSTKVYDNGEYKDYTETAISQMIGRAGRPQFDTSATALILTTLKDKMKYEKMVGGTEPVESNLHRHLTEHLNAEVVLHTITDLDVALKWLSSTFLYIRARKNPKHYGLSVGLTSEEIDKRLLDMAKIYINKLVKAGMLSINGQQQLLTPMKTGQLMAKYCLAFETVKLFTKVRGDEILQQIVELISKCQEFSDMFLRTHDKKCLNLLNKNKTGETIRFPLTGKIKTLDMKINCVIQAILGCLDIGDHSILTETLRIMRYAERIVSCLIEYLETRNNCYSALLNSVIMAKCIRTKLWENSPHICKQFGGIGIVMSSQLVKSGKTSFEAISQITGREIEFILNKKPPMGSNILDQVLHLPKYSLTLQKVDNKSFQLIVTLENASELTRKITANSKSCMVLIAGDSFNHVLHYEKLTHGRMIQQPEIVRFLDVPGEYERVEAHLISEDWVGLDCNAMYKVPGLREVAERKKQAKTRGKSQKPAATPSNNGSYMEKFLQLYQKQCAESAKKQPETVEQQNKKRDDSKSVTDLTDHGENVRDICENLRGHSENVTDLSENVTADDWDHVGAIENPMSSGKSDNDEELFWNDEQIDTFLQNLDHGMENLDGDDAGKRQVLLDKAYNEIWGKDSEKDKCQVGALTQMKEQLDDFVDLDDFCGPKTPKVTDKPESNEEDYWKELEMQYSNLKNFDQIPSSEQNKNEPESRTCNMNQDFESNFQDFGPDSFFNQSRGPIQNLQTRFGQGEASLQQVLGEKRDTNNYTRRYSSTATNNQPIIDVGVSNERSEAAERIKNLCDAFGQRNFYEKQIWGSNEIEPEVIGRSSFLTSASDLYRNRIKPSDQHGLNNNSFDGIWEHDLTQDTVAKKRQLANERLFDSDLSKSARSEIDDQCLKDLVNSFEENSRVVDLTRLSNSIDSSRSNLSKCKKSDHMEETNRDARNKHCAGSTPEERIDRSFDRVNAVVEQTWGNSWRDERDSSKESNRLKPSGSISAQNEKSADQGVVKKNIFEEQIWGFIPKKPQRFETDLSESARAVKETEGESFDDEIHFFEENSKPKVIDLTRWSNSSKSTLAKSEKSDQGEEIITRDAGKRSEQSICQGSTLEEARFGQSFESNAFPGQTYRSPVRNERGFSEESSRFKSPKSGSVRKDDSNKRVANVKRNLFEEQIWGSIRQGESSLNKWPDEQNGDKSTPLRGARNLSKESSRSKSSINGSVQNQRNERNWQGSNQGAATFEEQMWGAIRQGESSLNKWSEEQDLGDKTILLRDGRNSSNILKLSRNGSIQDQRNERNRQGSNQGAATFEEQIWESIRQGESSLNKWSDEKDLGDKSAPFRDRTNLIKESTKSQSSRNVSVEDQRNERNLQGSNQSVTFEEQIWGSVPRNQSGVVQRCSDKESFRNYGSRSLLDPEPQSGTKSEPLLKVYEHTRTSEGASIERKMKRPNLGCQIDQRKSNQDETASQGSFYSLKKIDEDEKKHGHIRKQTRPKRAIKSQLSFTDIQAVVKRTSPIQTTTPSSVTSHCKKFKYTPRKKLTSPADNESNKPHKLDPGSPLCDNAAHNDERQEEMSNRKITWRSPLVYSPDVMHTPKLGKKIETPPQSRHSSLNDYYSHVVLSSYRDSPKLSVKDGSSYSLPSTMAKTQTVTGAKPQKYKTKPATKPLPLPLSDLDYKDSSKDESRDYTNELDGSLNRTSLSEQLRRSQVETVLTPPQNTPSLSDFYSQILRKYDTPRPQLSKRAPSPPPEQASLSKTPKIPQSLLPLSDLECNKRNDGPTNSERKLLLTQDSYYSEMMKNYQQNLEKNAAKNVKSMSSGNDFTSTSESYINERRSPVETFESFRSGLEALRSEHANKELFNCSQFSALPGARMESNGATEDSGVNTEMSRPLVEQMSPMPVTQPSHAIRRNYEMSELDGRSGYQNSRRFEYGIDGRRQRMEHNQRPLSPLHEMSLRSVTDDSGVMMRRPPLSPIAAFLSREPPLSMANRRDYELSQSFERTDSFDYDRDRYSSRRFGYDIGIEERPPMHYPRHSQFEPYSQGNRYEQRRYEPYSHRELYRPSYDVPYRDNDYRSQRYNAPVSQPLPYTRPRSSYRPRITEQELMPPRELIGRNYMIRRYLNSIDEGRGEEDATDHEFFSFDK